MRLRFSTFISAIIAVLWTTGCRSSQYEWAYAENLDGTILENESCRQNLARVPYENDGTLSIEQSGNSFTVKGQTESYRIFAFHTEDACAQALANIKQGK
jgi:hypothetical protein